MAFCSVGPLHGVLLPHANAPTSRSAQQAWTCRGRPAVASPFRTPVRLPTARRGPLHAAATEDVAQEAATVEERSDVNALHAERPAKNDAGEGQEAASSSQEERGGPQEERGGEEGPSERREGRGDGWRTGAYRGRGFHGRGREDGFSRGVNGFRTDARPGPPEPDPRRAPCTEHNLRRYDVVIGKVVKQLFRGSLVELQDDPRIIGFVRHQDGPFCMKERVAGHMGDIPMPVGLLRPFKILAIPDDMEYYGRGPLLAAKELDLDVLWARARQIQSVCEQDAEVLSVAVTDANSGGLLATLCSLPAFLPFSLMIKEDGASWHEPEELRKAWVGKDILVTVREVSPERRKVLIDMQQAAANQLMKTFAVGSLVWGTVRRVEPYGVFVGIDGTRLSGLLHISCISRSHIDAVDEIFAEGDRVRAMLLGMDEGFSRISLSTADLERQPGDMLFDRERVYAGADETVQHALARLNLLREDEGGADVGGRDYNSGARDDFDFNGDFQQ